MSGKRRGGRRLLSGIGCCQVEQCGCGTIQIRMGDISIRISEESMETITTVLVDASLKLRDERKAELEERHLTLMQGGLSGVSDNEEDYTIN